MKKRESNPKIPAKKLENLMKKHGHTAYYLDKVAKIGVGELQIRNIITGKYAIQLNTASKIMEFYGVPTDWFLFDITNAGEVSMLRRIEELEKELEQYKKTSETFRKQMIAILEQEKVKV